MEYLFLLVGALLGGAVAWLLVRAQAAALVRSVEELAEKRITELKEASARQLQDTKQQYEGQLQDLKEQSNAQLQDTKQQYERQLRDLKEQSNVQLLDTKQQHQLQLNELRQRQDEQLKQQLELLREQMHTTSERLLKQRAEELSHANKEQLSVILNPLQSHILQMREAVEKTTLESHTTMERLDATIKQSIEQSREVGERADKLAQALTSENKTQGDFGELRLKQMLQEMGLEEGVQFEEQAMMRDASGHVIVDEESGHRMIPDVILHFPDQRDVIIDSKMSFTAFERYHAATTDEERQVALQQHIASVRSHVKELAHKNYSKYIQEGRGRLDFVLMYVFSESALQLALSNDATLWREAYHQGVIITGSQNLYVMLRVLEMTWKQVQQVENQQRIMECANSIVDRVQMFVERFEDVKDLLGRTQKAFDSLDILTAPSGRGIITSARQLVKMGAKENPKRKKALPTLEEDESPLLAEDELGKGEE